MKKKNSLFLYFSDFGQYRFCLMKHTHNLGVRREKNCIRRWQRKRGKKCSLKAQKKESFPTEIPVQWEPGAKCLLCSPFYIIFNISPFIDTKYTVIQWSIKFNGLFIGTAGSLKPLALEILSKIYISGKLIPVLERIILG